MTETAFEKLLDESLTTLNFEQGALISGVIVDVSKETGLAVKIKSFITGGVLENTK